MTDVILDVTSQLVRTLGKKACDVTAKITTFSANLSWKIRVEKNIEPA